MVAGQKGDPNRLVEVRRGAEPDELYLIAENGATVIARAYGYNVEEQVKTREHLLRLIQGVLARKD